jgi:beta-galactosidase
MYVGVDYYPEHWPKTRWATDAKLMKAAGFNVVRLAEFAWVKMEPEEGRFDFRWLDEALSVLHKQGISAILGTPTAAMPAWVARKYPETLAMQLDGQRITWGVRKNNCFSAGAYRLLSQRITKAMAQHFAANPAVIGWQTDNEFGSPQCYCDNCKGTWQDWLKAKYGSLDEVNRAWGTHFWGHKVQTWGEIHMPADMHAHNPSLCLDWKRFWSWQNVRFQHDQTVILRRECPRHFITHNLMGFAPDVNYFDLSADLDHASWDNYPSLGGAEAYDPAASADLMRGVKGKNFWIMEQTAGPHGWGSYTRNPRPGEMRKQFFQQVGHGADGFLWFRWRSCTVGREQYWHGLLGHDGKAFRRYREAAQTAKDFHKVGKELAGTTVKAEAAMFYDYDSVWAFDIQPAYNGWNFFGANASANRYQEAVKRYHRALFRAGVNVDLVRPGQDLSGYKLVLAPHQYVMPDPLAQQLSDYVRQGGVLLCDSRTGVKDATGLCHERTLPGLLSRAFGIRIEEYEALHEGVSYATQSKTSGLPGAYQAVQTCDWITPEKAETLLAYKDWHLKGLAAVTQNKFGRGQGFYVGANFQEDAFYDHLVAGLLKAARIQPLVVPPAGVEATARQGANGTLLFLINHTEEPKAVKVPAGKVDLLTGKKTAATLQLGIYGVAILKI